MSAPYRHTQTNDGFVSVFTGKVYRFDQTPDGRDRNRALNELQKEDGPLVQAANARARKELGRELTVGELIRGNWGNDPRPLRQRIADDGRVTASKPNDTSDNVYSSYVTELHSRNAFTSDDKVALQRRIERAESLEANHEKELIAKRELEESRNSVSYAKAKLDAELWVAKLRLDVNAPQHYVTQAQRRLNDLQKSNDTNSYWQKTLQFETERQLQLKETADALDAQAAQLRGEAQAVRTGEPVESAATPAN